MSAAKIIAILTQVLLPSGFPGPRSVIHTTEIEHSHPDNHEWEEDLGSGASLVRPWAAVGPSSSFWKLPVVCFQVLPLWGQLGEPALALWACAVCGPGEALLPGTRNAGTRARCSFPVSLPVEPTASTLLLFGVWQNQRQEERALFARVLPGGPDAAPSSLPSPGYWAWCCNPVPRQDAFTKAGAPPLFTYPFYECSQAEESWRMRWGRLTATG